MAQTIATISLCLFIIVLQHLHNWVIRKLNDVMEEYSSGLLIASSVLVVGITFILFRLLLQIN
jgi:hypothetical protein